MNWPGARADEMVSTEAEKKRRRWPFWVLGVVVLIAAGAGALRLDAVPRAHVVQVQRHQLLGAELAATSSPAPGETVYRIDPTRSALSYAVEEKLFGQDAHEAKGTTNGIAGDIAVNATDPAASRVGQIVVNVEQLHSDNNLRDARLRAANLELARVPARVPHRSRTSPTCPRSSRRATRPTSS